MSLLRKAGGNMYPWVSHVCSPVKGCFHSCSYCYYPRILKRYGHRVPKHVRFDAKGWDKVNLDGKTPKTIFIAHLTDLFAEDVPDKWIKAVLSKCQDWPANTYVFQSKNPKRFQEFLDCFPPLTIYGTTVETDLPIIAEILQHAPAIKQRVVGLLDTKINAEVFGENGTTHPSHLWPKFITVEPIMNFTLSGMTKIIDLIKPDFMSIGADSKKSGLPEPSRQDIMELINEINLRKIKLYIKSNLKRLIK